MPRLLQNKDSQKAEKFLGNNPMSSENSSAKADVWVGNFRVKTSKTFAQIIGFLSTNLSEKSRRTFDKFSV